MTQPAPLTSTTFVDGELTNEAKWYTRVFTAINWLLSQFGDTGWQTLTLGNSWAAFGAPDETPQARVKNGVVYLAGEMKSGTTGTTVTTLGTGYKPLSSIVFLTASNNGAATIAISAAGILSVVSYITPGSNANVSLNGISYIAEQ